MFAVKEQIAIGEVPEHCSVGLAIDVLRTMMHHWSERPERDDRFQIRLRRSLQDGYKRASSKEARYHPNFKVRPKAGKPPKHKLFLAQYLTAP